LLAEVWLWLALVVFGWLQPAQTGSGYLWLAETCIWLAPTFGWLRLASGWLWLPLAG